jgi:hypothetical protein
LISLAVGRADCFWAWCLLTFSQSSRANEAFASKEIFNHEDHEGHEAHKEYKSMKTF